MNEMVKLTRSRTKEMQRSPALPFAPTSDGPLFRASQDASGLLSRALDWISTRRLGRSSTRRLQVAESVSLGEKRFVAVIKVDGLQFLIGGGATNVALLAQLHAKDSFGNLLNETMLDCKKKPTAEHTGDQA